MLRLENGDGLLLPFNLYPDNGRMRGWYQTVSGKRGERKVEFFDKALTVSGWPRPDRSFNEKLGLSGFGFNGQCVPAKTGEYLATMYGYFQGDQRYSLVLVESTDGIDWKFRSLIAGADCKLAGGEGPCESVTVRLKDGRLMNVFRLASNVPYGQTFSDDDGRTWSEPVAMKDAHSVQPSLVVMKDGAVEQTNFDKYNVARMPEAPKQVHVHLVPSTELPAGIGEPGVPPVAPAIANAIFAATGKRVRELPLRKAKLV